MENERKLSKLYPIFRHACALIFWIYLITPKSIIFCADKLLESKLFPFSSVDILQYKFYLVAILLAIARLSLGKNKFYALIFFTATYPFRIATYPFRTPAQSLLLTIIKENKPLATKIAMIFIVVALTAKALKPVMRRITDPILLIGACTIILLNEGNVASILSMIYLLILLIRHHFKRYYSVFGAKSVLKRMDRILKEEWVLNEKNFLLKDYFDNVKYPKDSEEYVKKKADTANILTLVSFGFTFIAGQLKKFSESRFLTVDSMFKIVMTFALTTVIFSFLLYALSMIQPDSFSPKVTSSFFLYLYYSFNVILSGNIPEITAASYIAKILISLERIFGLSIFVFLFFIFTTINRDKSEKELHSVITQLENNSNDLRHYLGGEFNKTPEEIEGQYTIFRDNITKMKNKMHEGE